ncbi:MAG TPA: hypothetical protein VE959_09450 [Bryobacteraceae bacterium]|nr:hypothetical protein [Bryobacteraceae bacterium]
MVVPRQNADKRRPDGHTVQLYGWDSRSHSWHGPNELGHGSTGTQKLYEALRGAPGQSWYGPVNCSASGEPGRFFALAHALRDCGVAMVYCDESKSGPAEIVTVIPAEQRARLRPEFAFEFVAFAGFLGSIGTGADMAVNDCIEAALAETAQDDSLVFSISTGLWVSDLDHVLSRCVEKIAIAMLRWLEHSKI